VTIAPTTLSSESFSRAARADYSKTIPIVDLQRDALYKYDADAHNDLVTAKPWAKDPHYFKSVRISAVALLKMVMHARSGGSLEVMGLMQGYILPETFVVTREGQLETIDWPGVTEAAKPQGLTDGEAALYRVPLSTVAALTGLDFRDLASAVQQPTVTEATDELVAIEGRPDLTREISRA